MFRAFRNSLMTGGRSRLDASNLLSQLHPYDLSALLEHAWDRHVATSFGETGGALHRSDVLGMAGSAILRNINVVSPKDSSDEAQAFLGIYSAINNRDDKNQLLWSHLIYAYMIESPGTLAVMTEMMSRLLHSEKLGIPTLLSQRWLRTTEELFFRDASSFFIGSLVSRLRPDIHATRRNAYQRMFGMDPVTDKLKPYPYIQSEVYNGDFAQVFQELLREVWIGISNKDNTSGQIPTDNAKIYELADRLHDMLLSRRKYGNLAREEFAAVALMSWFHMTLEDDLPIIADVGAIAASPEERLKKIGALVGVPVHASARSFLEMADSMAYVLLLIESGQINDVNAAEAFYRDATLSAHMNKIITHWAAPTGNDVKATRLLTAA